MLLQPGVQRADRGRIAQQPVERLVAEARDSLLEKRLAQPSRSEIAPIHGEVLPAPLCPRRKPAPRRQGAVTADGQDRPSAFDRSLQPPGVEQKAAVARHVEHECNERRGVVGLHQRFRYCRIRFDLRAKLFELGRGGSH
jgi:hypothetical protein